MVNKTEEIKNVYNVKTLPTETKEFIVNDKEEVLLEVDFMAQVLNKLNGLEQLILDRL